jgi:endothelin-converting enzyme/putative endopeptidase
MKGRPVVFIALATALACRTASAPTAAGGTDGAAAATRGDAAAAASFRTAIDPAVLDPGVKPCGDFYAYACGGWLKTTAIPPDKPVWSRGFSELSERNLARLREIAERAAAGGRAPDDRYAEKVGDFWAACMDEAVLERRGLTDLHAAWSRIDRVTDLTALAREVGLLHASGVTPLFEITSGQDAKDATVVIGEVVQAGLGLPDRDYYLKEDAPSFELQRAYREYVGTMLRRAGLSAAEATSDAHAIFHLERAMAEAHWSRVEMRDPLRTYNRVDLDGLRKQMPRFPWEEYLAELGHPDLRTFSITTPRFLSKLDELLDATPPATWRAYLKWKLLAAMAASRALPKAFSDERFAFQSRHFTGAKEQEARWKHCVRITDAALGEAIGQAYVRRYFGEDGKEKTRRLVSEVEAAMGRTLDALGWMDAPTKEKAREKLARVHNKVGYPDSWRNYDALRTDRSSFFRTVLAANAFEVHRTLDKIGKPVDRGEWEMSPPTVNAYYHPALNEMVFPAGILQQPFFARSGPDAVNYGAIGMVVAHELTHGFDDQGRRFDAAGNLADWWTPAVAKEFERRAACVVKQYDEYVAVDDVKLNGKLTLGENIADLGGVKLAFEAYQASRKGKPPEPPVAGFTAEQAFFVGYAQSWCTAIRPEYARLHAQTDPHSPPEWRVNGVLSSSLPFRSAFACSDGDRMVRPAADRCEVW